VAAASYPVADVRSDVERKAKLTAEELERDLNDWVAAAPTERIRTSRAADAESRELTEERDAQRWALEAYDAVLRGVGVCCDALGSDDPEVRLWAAYLLGWFPKNEAPACLRSCSGSRLSRIRRWRLPPRSQPG
jgi:hypothetical protein